MNLRTEAVSHLNHFCENFLSQYSKSRNFDYGKDKRDNTSCLSKYITHRIIDELEVIKSAHSKYPYLTIEAPISQAKVLYFHTILRSPVTVHAYVPSNGICRGFAFKYGKFLLPPRFLTALSVPKVPTREP